MVIKMKRNISLDIIRIFAAIMVLMVHAFQHTNFDFSVGANGVQCFFILSAYLSFKKLEYVNTKDYYKNRIKKIIPPYYLALILILVITFFENVIVTKSFSNSFSGLISIKYIRYFVFAQCIIPSNDWNLWNNTHALWTMSSFAFFYICAPILYKCINSLLKSLLFLASTFAIKEVVIYFILNYIDGNKYDLNCFSYMNPLAELYVFALGIVIYYAIKDNKIIHIGLITSMYLVITQFKSYEYELLFTILIMLGAYFPINITNSKINKAIISFSNITFVLYLIHPIVFEVERIILQKINNIIPPILNVIVMCVCAVICAYIMNMVLNRIINHKKK